jgi:hypothetical protein
VTLKLPEAEVGVTDEKMLVRGDDRREGQAAPSQPRDSRPPRQGRRRYVTDQCSVCGRFVGLYPMGFYCDTHCYRCVCVRCPGFREPPR